MFREGWSTLWHPKPHFWLISGALIILNGCGYTLSHRLNPYFNSARLMVPQFENLTEEVGVERFFTQAFVRELKTHEPELVTGEGNATHQLKGTLVSIQVSPTANTEPGFRGLTNYRRLPTELGVTVVTRVALKTKDGQKTLWEKQFQNFRRISPPSNRAYDYEAVSSIPLYNQSLVEQMLREQSRDMAREMYDAMVDF